MVKALKFNQLDSHSLVVFDKGMHKQATSSHAELPIYLTCFFSAQEDMRRREDISFILYKIQNLR